MRPDWPIPQEPNQIFYLQRSENRNTVVYTALFDPGGTLRADRPAQVYWRRYNTTGERKVLKAAKETEAYYAIESPKGEIGFYIVGNGTPNPDRCRVRPPSFYNLQIVPELTLGHLLSDMVAIIGTTDIVLGEIDR